MATNSSAPEEDGPSEPTAGFEFATATDDHEIEAAYSWRYVDRIYLTDDGEIRRSEDTDGTDEEELEQELEDDTVNSVEVNEGEVEAELDEIKDEE